MWEFIKETEAAELIFYGLMIALFLAEIILRYVLKVAKNNIVLEYVDSGFIAILIALVLRLFLIQAFKIPSSSMENTLLIGDHLLVNKFIYGTNLPFTDKQILKFKDPERGDIIIFKYPRNPRKSFIKRCVGVPGDKIEIRDKVVYINDKVQQEEYIVHKDFKVLSAYQAPRDNFGPIIVPEKHYFMMGDNRDFSSDSRFWGTLDRKFIRGKAWVIYFPITRWRKIE